MRLASRAVFFSAQCNRNRLLVCGGTRTCHGKRSANNESAPLDRHYDGSDLMPIFKGEAPPVDRVRPAGWLQFVPGQRQHRRRPRLLPLSCTQVLFHTDGHNLTAMRVGDLKAFFETNSATPCIKPDGSRDPSGADAWVQAG